MAKKSEVVEEKVVEKKSLIAQLEEEGDVALFFKLGDQALFLYYLFCLNLTHFSSKMVFILLYWFL